MALSDCCTTSIVYQPPPPAPAGPVWEIPWLVILPLVLVLAFIIYLTSFTPAPKPVEKTLREEINGVFDQISQEASLFGREQVIGPLAKAQKKIVDILDKRKL
jgi:hypothetical protein